MRGLIDWKLIRPFASETTTIRLRPLKPIMDKYFWLVKRVFGRHIPDTPSKWSFILPPLYSILFAVRKRSLYFIRHGETQLGWKLTNCVPAAGKWQGLNLTEAGRFCGKVVCPWCYFRKQEKIKTRVMHFFPKAYSIFSLVRLGRESIYDRLQRLGFNEACRQEILTLNTKYIRLTNYRLGERPGLVNTVFVGAGTVWQDKPLPVKITSMENLDNDIATALEFPAELLLKPNYDEALKYIKAIYNSKQFSYSREK